jgi:hypothetical protein
MTEEEKWEVLRRAYEAMALVPPTPFIEGRKCPSCNAPIQSAYKNDVFNENRKCERCNWLNYKYKITHLDYAYMLAKQRGVCAICKKEETIISKKTNKPRDLVIDHCHTTGKVRGLLCGGCNSGIGMLRDSDEALWNAIIYLKRSRDTDSFL